jgi:4-alpha-glucanotransferase
MSSSDQHERTSGLLLHITSLPGEFGIGDLGPEAHQFARELSAAGQRYWQLLPVGPTVSANSPYSSSSTFGGNPLLISPDLLWNAGLIAGDELEEMKLPDVGRVPYAAVRAKKMPALRRAAHRFTDRADPGTQQRYEEFQIANGPLWLDDFCLYVASRESQGGGDREARVWRDVAMMESARSEFATEIEAHRVIQFLFFEQWDALRETCRSAGVEVVGDLPLYVALESADVWAHPEAYQVDADGKPIVVAGVPPDYYSETGQRWGNPIYDWQAMAESGFAWWRARLQHAVAMFDVIRIDHFRGIAGYWEIPAGDATAATGRWRHGPGAPLLKALEDEIGHLPLIAEDLGVITDDVIALRDGFGLPGMRVAQFGFDDAFGESIHHPDQYPENVWAYTGTHDNDTAFGWFWRDDFRHRWWRLPKHRRRLYRALGGDIPGGLMAWVARSRANTVVFPVQDLLRLGSGARMNLPGTSAGNWEWRLRGGQLGDEALDELLSVTRETGRS